jgi:hypothetical protein
MPSEARTLRILTTVAVFSLFTLIGAPSSLAISMAVSTQRVYGLVYTQVTAGVSCFGSCAKYVLACCRAMSLPDLVSQGSWLRQNEMAKK